MTHWVIDWLAITGGVLIAGGVLLNAGAGWSMVCAGVQLIGLVLHSAKEHNRAVEPAEPGE